MTESAISKNDVPLEASIPDGVASLESILCTEELRRRPSRPPDYKKENRALVALSSALADSPRTILQTLAETILEVTQSDSSGLSLLTTDDGGKRFYWPAIAGIWKPHIGGETPRNFGPCGDVLDRNIPLARRHIERRYTYFLPVTPLVEECLLVPFYVGGKAVGTIWAAMHDDRREFDAEDERLMSALGQFASLAYQTLTSIDDLKFQIAEREKAETALRELTNTLEERVSQRTHQLSNLSERLSRETLERKSAEERIAQTAKELQRSEFYLEQGQLLSHCGSWSFLPSGECDYWSPELYKILGFDPSKGIPALSDYVKRVHPDNRSIVEKTLKNMIAEGISCDIKKRIVRTDGALRVIRCVGIPVFEMEKVVRFVGTLIDITEQEKLTQELRRSKFYLQEGERLACMGSWSLKPDGIFDYWSPETFLLFSFDPAKGIPMLTEMLTVVHREDRDRIVKTVERMFREGGSGDITYRVVHPEQGLRIMHSVGEPVSEEGKVTRLIGNTLDITEQERLTQELQRREAYLAQAQALSHTGSFGWNLSTGELVWSAETFQILDYKRTVKPTLELVFERVHPDDIALVRETLARASKDGRGFDFEHRLLLPSGSIKRVHVVARPFECESGSIEFVGSVMDVTARQKAFEEIKALKDELYKENIALREEIDTASMFEEIVGASPPLKGVLARVSKVAPTDSTVLITGETGTGKELIARAIHKRSKRSSRGFVSVNCAAIPADLVASELFGHEKGAFTGALQRRIGRFELAEGGTIFLDEIGELPPETQIALLRVLQEREFERVGGGQPIRADTRLIAATNRDLKAAIASGSFRSDLFYRLNVFPIEMPSLRARKEDIPVLTEYFIHRYAGKMGRKISGISKKTLQMFQSYAWPGNIRELQNVIERSLIVCETESFTVDESWLAREPLEIGTPTQPLSQRLATDQKTTIEAALAETRGRVSGPSGAAMKLGMPASTLESKIRALNINKHRFKTV